MLQSLYAVLVPAAFCLQPLGPVVLTEDAAVGVRVESNLVTAENLSDSTRWIVFSSGSFHTVRALAPHSGLEWACTESCLWDVQLQVADTDGGVLHLSESVSLYAALERDVETLWFGTSPTCWSDTGGQLVPFFGDAESSEAPLDSLHVPVSRPTGTPGGDLPPPIEGTPLPPV